MLNGVLRKIAIDTLIPIVFGVIYLILPTKMYYIDGVYYAEHLENIPWYINGFHPHHLLFLPLAHLFYGIIHSLIPSLKAITYLQASNAITGALTIRIFLSILKRAGAGLTSRIYSAIILASAYTFWHHSTDADIYIPAHFLTLLVTYMVLSKSFRGSPANQIASGLLLGFAGLIHQIALLSIVPYVIYIITTEGKACRSVLTRFLIPVLLVLFISYPLVFAIYHGETPATGVNFVRWVTAFGQSEHYFTLSDKNAKAPVESIARGNTNAFFPLKPLEKILFDQKTGDTQTHIKLYEYILMLTLLSFFISLLVTINFKEKEKKAFGILFIFTFLIYFLITSVFMPENHFYRLFYLPSLIIILGLSISALPRTYKVILKPLIGILIAVFFIYNFSRGIIPESKAVNNPYLVMTRLIDNFATSNDVAIFAPRDRYFTGIYRYFGKGDALHLQTGKHFLDYDNLMMEIDKYEFETLEMLKNRYQRIYVSQDALKSGIDPIIFFTNNYRLPHPKFMVVRREKFQVTKWCKAGEQYFAEVAILPE